MSSNSAKELARVAAVSNHPITVLPPEPIPTKPPDLRWMAKWTPPKTLVPKSQNKLCVCHKPSRIKNFRKYGTQMPMEEMIFGAK